jgi:putative endonuclease
MQARKLGDLGEKIAARYLAGHGFKVIAQNFAISGGEIDLIATLTTADTKLIFIEVKTRRSHRFGRGEDSISFKKKRSLRKAISTYLNQNPRSPPPEIQFDIIDIHMDYLDRILSLEHFEDIELY